MKYYLKGCNYFELKFSRFGGKATMNFSKLVESHLAKALGWTVFKSLKQSL